MPGDGSFAIADRARVEALLDGLARRLHAELGDDLVLLGVRRRGAPLARALASRLETLARRAIPVEEIRLSRYDDDLTVLHEEPVLEAEGAAPALRGANAVVVDDVLYSGRTLLRAVRWALERGAVSVHAAVLCTRGAADVPIHADFAALRLDVGPTHVIEVCVPPFESDLGVLLRPRPG